MTTAADERPQSTPDPADDPGRRPSVWPGWWWVWPVGAAGLLVVAIGDALARSGRAGGSSLFWLGFLIVVAVPTALLVGRSAGRGLRVGVLVYTAGLLYLVKVIQAPAGFVFHDEFGWQRQVTQYLATGHLMHPNPFIANFGSYPGLTAVTGTVVQLTGLSTHQAGVLVIGLGRLAFVALLFAIFELVGGSGRAAGVATLIYLGNPEFVQFDTDFSYESLAIVLAVAAVWLTVRAVRAGSWWLTGAAAATVVALAVTHHVTGYVVAALLVAWNGLRARRGRGWAADARLLTVTAVAVLAELGWFLAEARQTTVGELGPVARGSFDQLGDLLTGHRPARALFAAKGGVANSAWAQWTGYASVLLLLVGLVAGLVVQWRRRWPDRRGDAVTVGGPLRALLVGVAVLYPATLVLRLTSAANESANRSSVYVFTGLAVVVTAAIGRLCWPVEARVARHSARDADTGAPPGPGRARLRAALIGGGLVVVVVGGFVVGTAPYSRLPGSYRVAADPRSIDDYGVAAGQWIGAHVPADTPIVADLTGTELITGYSSATPLSGGIGAHPVSEVYFASTLTPTVRQILASGRVGYVWVDDRMCTSLPLNGHYFSADEPKEGYRQPPSCAALHKFAGQPGIGLVYDNGPIQIYSVADYWQTGP